MRSTTADKTEPDGSVFTDALEWFHNQQDRGLPEAVVHDTPRDYYREGCGWDAETI